MAEGSVVCLLSNQRDIAGSIIANKLADTTCESMKFVICFLLLIYL